MWYSAKQIKIWLSLGSLNVCIRSLFVNYVDSCSEGGFRLSRNACFIFEIVILEMSLDSNCIEFKLQKNHLVRVSGRSGEIRIVSMRGANKVWDSRICRISVWLREWDFCGEGMAKITFLLSYGWGFKSLRKEYCLKSETNSFAALICVFLIFKII